MHRLRSFGRHFVFYFIMNVLMFSLFSFVRYSLLGSDWQDETITQFVKKFGELRYTVILVGLSSIVLASFASAVDILLLKPLQLRLSMGLLILIEICVQFALIFLIFQIDESILNLLLKRSGLDYTFRFTLAQQRLIMIVMFVNITFGRIFIEIDRKLGHGNIYKMFLGRFYNPIEEERMFMFIDLKDSTSIAEQIGHLKFSQFIKACFNNLIIVEKYNAEVYQYVGDEVVLTWCPKKAFKKANYLQAFYGFVARLKSKEPAFLKEFGIIPTFKASVHIGQIVTTEVGILKREISYHGDTINTAARIQAKCNEMEAHLLISKAVLDRTEDKAKHSFTDKGSIQLKGKQKEVRVFKVEPI